MKELCRKYGIVVRPKSEPTRQMVLGTGNQEKEFIGPGLHRRPVHADHAQPPFQWTLNSVFSAYENNNRRIRPPPDRGTLKIVSRLLIA